MISSIKAFCENVINVVSSIDDLSISSITSIKKITVIVHPVVIRISNLCQSMHKSHAKCVVSTCPLILQGTKDFPLSFLLNKELVKHRHSLDLAILPRSSLSCSLLLVFRGGSGDFANGWCSMLATMVG